MCSVDMQPSPRPRIREVGDFLWPLLQGSHGQKHPHGCVQMLMVIGLQLPGKIFRDESQPAQTFTPHTFQFSIPGYS